MVIDKQTMQRARRMPDAHAHRAIQTALDNLDTRPAPRRTRWVPTAAAGAAALMLVAVLAAVPPLRHRAVSIALDALGRAVPQSDRVNPAAGGALLQPSALPESSPARAAQATAEAEATQAIALTDLPKPYPPEQAVANGDYVNVHGQTSNTGRMTAFLQAVSAKRLAAIRCTNYTVEGDAIIADIEFDGSKFTVNIDTTRDAFGEQKVTHSEYRNMREYEQSGTILVYLTNVDQITEALSKNGFDGYLLTTRSHALSAEITATPQPTPDATDMPSDESQGGVLPDEPTPVPSASAGATQPKFDAQAEGWTEYDIELGSKSLSIAAPSNLKRYDLTTPEQRVHLASLKLSYNDETDGVTGWPSVPSLLNDNSFPLVFFDGEDGVIQVLAYDPGTASMDGAVQKLDALWSCGDTSEDAAGNQVTQLIGRTTDKYQSTSSLLLYRLPKGVVTIDGKSQPCPFLVVRVVSHKERDLWMAILQDNISIQ